MCATGETLTPAPTVAEVRPMPSGVPECPVERTAESDPKKAGDQGELTSEYRATDASGMSVNPLEESVPNVVRPKPGAALSESQDRGRN